MTISFLTLFTFRCEWLFSTVVMNLCQRHELLSKILSSSHFPLISTRQILQPSLSILLPWLTSSHSSLLQLNSHLMQIIHIMTKEAEIVQRKWEDDGHRWGVGNEKMLKINDETFCTVYKAKIELPETNNSTTRRALEMNWNDSLFWRERRGSRRVTMMRINCSFNYHHQARYIYPRQEEKDGRSHSTTLFLQQPWPLNTHSIVP